MLKTQAYLTLCSRPATKYVWLHYQRVVRFTSQRNFDRADQTHERAQWLQLTEGMSRLPIRISNTLAVSFLMQDA